MKPIILISLLFIFIKFATGQENHNQPTLQFNKIEALEVIQTTKYTYLKTMENGKEKWIAAPYTEAQKGQTLYYTDGFIMVNFEGKEAGRTFDTIMFTGKIYKEPIIEKRKEKTKLDNNKPHAMKGHGKKNVKKKLNLTINRNKDEISLKQLLEKPKKFKGKTIKIKGQVTKFNEQIMGKNWIHIQDGTEHNGKYDLTITSQEIVKVGDIVTIKGKVALDKDFGFGYKYDVIIENGEISY